MRTGRRTVDGADRNMRTMKCGRKNADDKMRMTKCGSKITNDTMQMIKSFWGKFNLRCFLKLLVVNKPLVIFYNLGREKSNILYSITKQVKTFLRRLNPKSYNNRLEFYRQTPLTPFFLHYSEALSLFNIKPTSDAENRHCQIKWSTATIKQ